MNRPFDSVLRVMRWLVEALRKLVAGLVIVFFSYMAIAVLVQIAGRYVFNYSIDWTAETATFAQI
jgi:C4-dicarboxylate transporter DctQ subunit